MGVAKYTLDASENPANYRIGFSSNVSSQPGDITNWKVGITETEITPDGNYTVFINKIGSDIYYQQFVTVLCNVCTIKSLKPLIKTTTPTQKSYSSIALIGVME